MNHSLLKQSYKTITAFGICAGMLMAQPIYAGVKPYKKAVILVAGEEDKPARKNKAKTKTFVSLNNSSVKIYPDMIKRDMHVVAKDNDGKEVDFFVFDAEGSLVQHYKMQAKDHNKMSGLARGKYIYRVFSGDVETATGNFEIR